MPADKTELKCIGLRDHTRVVPVLRYESVANAAERLPERGLDCRRVEGTLRSAKIRPPEYPVIKDDNEDPYHQRECRWTLGENRTLGLS